ncbi:MAG: proteasome subunit beta [Candidatus Lokiarchaeota archaeon]|nr:proteasome subunit beta [Candidatus Lokiarchaeota archaeon]
METKKDSANLSMPSEIIKTGTTTIGLKYKDGVIIATESQATAGTFIASTQAQKLFKINTYSAATMSGSVADCQFVINQIRALSNIREIDTGKVPSVKYIANLVRNIVYSGRGYYLALLIIGGFSEEESKGKLYGIDFVGTLFEEDSFLSYGSGSPYALGVIEAEWKPELTEKQAIDLVKRALKSAITRDSGSGFNFQIVKITKDGFHPIEGYMD